MQVMSGVTLEVGGLKQTNFTVVISGTEKDSSLVLQSDDHFRWTGQPFYAVYKELECVLSCHYFV